MPVYIYRLGVLYDTRMRHTVRMHWHDLSNIHTTQTSPHTCIFIGASLSEPHIDESNGRNLHIYHHYTNLTLSVCL